MTQVHATKIATTNMPISAQHMQSNSSSTQDDEPKHLAFGILQIRGLTMQPPKYLALVI
jgi:hypothetical protein